MKRGTRLAVLTLLACAGRALAQDAAPPAAPEHGVNGRRHVEGPPTVLAFKSVKVDQVIPFIVEATGKVVMPQPDVLTRTVTVLNDRPIPREQALDLVFLALHQAGIAVVETETIVTLRDIGEITRQDVPVIGPMESVRARADLGSMAEKIFPLRSNSAEAMGELLKDAVPDYAKLTIDKESNQIAIMGNIALLKRMEVLIEALDRPSSDALITETFRLRYADAELVAENIRELFSADGARTNTGNRGGNNNNRGGNNNNQNQGDRFRQFFGPGGQGGQGQQNQGSASPSQNLRVTANTQQNAVTVVAEQTVIDQVRDQIETFWDLPLPDEAVVPKVYDLKNSDAVKVRDLLEGLFGQGTPTGGGQGANAGSTQGVGRLAGQFSFEAIPEASRLVVVAKSPDNMAVIDKIIEDLDQPQSVGLPAIVELKHASAEELAEQLNALLAQDGTLASIRRAESGLSESSANESPFATDAQTDQQQEEADPDELAFWWQRSRPPTDNRGPSNLISKIRIVPVWRQNALMVLSPPEYKQSVVDLIESLDKPGRQVLLSAIVVEVSNDDATALGLRWSSQVITPTNANNAVSVGSTSTGQQTNFLDSLFDTSVLDVNADLNLLLQALNQKTDVTILSEPRIFTSDNQEAEFFDGQDIPFVNELQTNNQGNPLQSFDYRAVGLQLRIRPRITVNRDVDLRVNLELSSITPGQASSNAFIVDRRETTTQLIVRDGQTIVISGILRTEESDIVRKIPLLGDIPIIGGIFRSREKGTSQTELLVFITPLVIENETESGRLNDPYRRRLDQLKDQLDANPETNEPSRTPDEG